MLAGRHFVEIDTLSKNADTVPAQTGLLEQGSVFINSFFA